MSRILEAFLANQEAIRRYAFRFLKRPEDVDDLTQELFLRTFAAEESRDIASPRAFLFRATKNLALNELAKKDRKTTDYIGDSDSLDVFNNEPQIGIDDELDARQRLFIMAQAIASLPPQCRRVFILRKVHGHTHKEIAVKLGISVKTIEKHLTVGTVKCAEYLRSQGFDPASFAKRDAYWSQKVQAQSLSPTGVGKSKRNKDE